MNAPATFALPCRVAKLDDERQIAYAVVLEPCGPDSPDAQGDWYTPVDIALGAWGFLVALAKGVGGADLMHNGGDYIGWVVESYLAPVDFVWGAGADVEVVKAGSWVMGIHYPDPAIWQQVRAGELGGLSIEGAALRHHTT